MKRHKLFTFIVVGALAVAFCARAAQAAPKLDPQLASRLQAAQGSDLFGVILTFHGERLTDAQVAQVAALGVTGGFRMRNLPVIAVNANAAQITQMLGWTSLRSVYLNAPVELYLHQTRPLIGVDRLRKDPDITRRNGGQPVSGKGVTIAINDTGVDGTHQDLTYNVLNPAAGKTIQNVHVNMSDKDGLLVRADSLGNLVEGIVPPVYVENQPNTDTHGGHGTHVASTAAGSGLASGRLYEGVAPGASVVGLGSGVGLFIVGQIAAFDYCLTNQFTHNIRVVNNSWGNSARDQDPDHPINVASKILHDNHIVVVFANGNDGPDPNSQNRWASWPWSINVGAATKDGQLAYFSSRGLFGHETFHPTILTPGTGGPADKGYTSAVVAARSRFNPAANGLHTDAEIPAAFLPNYTQISGTSMAAPHLAGIVANVLEADRRLLPDDVKALLERTATPLATYDKFEVGAGLANVHAAVDAAQNPSKPYGNFGFAGKGLAVEAEDGPSFEGSVAPNQTRSHTFTVPENARFTFVELNWGGVGEDKVVVDNTRIVAHDLALTVAGGGHTFSSDDLNAGGLFGAREGVKIEFAPGGTYTATVEAGFFQGSTATDQPYTLTVKHYLYDPNEVADASELDAATARQVYRLVYDRVMGTEGGFFRPADPLTRGELARALMLGARVPQFIPNRPSFDDLAEGTPEALFAESLRKEGVMGLGGATFGASAQVERLEQAVALVRALRLEKEAAQLAGTTVTAPTASGARHPLTDNAQIPLNLRGHVQLAIDRGLMAAYPAEVKQTGTGRFLVLPGPRFEPARAVTRADFVPSMTTLLSLMFGE
jgi:serine protease AprX